MNMGTLPFSSASLVILNYELTNLVVGKQYRMQKTMKGVQYCMLYSVATLKSRCGSKHEQKNYFYPSSLFSCVLCTVISYWDLSTSKVCVLH